MRGTYSSPTTILLVVNVAVYICTSLLGGSFLETSPLITETVGQFNLLVFRGWYWQILSSLFIHANIVHLAGNLLFLAIFGFRAEESFKTVPYLTIYFSSGLFGNLLSLLLGPFVVSVGASGAIFGLFGASAAYLRTAFGGALFYGVYLLVLNVGTGINVVAHFGGLLGGLLIGYVLSKRRQTPDVFL